MAIFQINQESCSKCGICTTECPVGVIVQKVRDYPKPHSSAEMNCIRCGHCVAICPTGSLSHRDIPVENCPLLNSASKPDVEQVTHLIRSRRSIRTYLDRPVPRDLITRAIDLGHYAPTGHNDQSVNWLIIDSPQEMTSLTTIGAEWMRWMTENQPEIASIFNFKKMIRQYETGHDKFLREAPAVVITHAAKNNPVVNIDCIIAMAYFDLAAQNMGLGCCWCGFALMAATTFPPMIEYLKIPEDHRIYGCLMVGYPRNKYQRLPERKEPKLTWR